MIINHGVRGSTPNPSQNYLFFGGNTPCVEIKTQKYQLIFDCGSGFSKVDFTNDLETILFISHFHHDHIQGLAFNNYFFEKQYISFYAFILTWIAYYFYTGRMRNV